MLTYLIPALILKLWHFKTILHNLRIIKKWGARCSMKVCTCCSAGGMHMVSSRRWILWHFHNNLRHISHSSVRWCDAYSPVWKNTDSTKFCSLLIFCADYGSVFSLQSPLKCSYESVLARYLTLSRLSVALFAVVVAATPNTGANKHRLLALRWQLRLRLTEISYVTILQKDTWERQRCVRKCLWWW